MFSPPGIEHFYRCRATKQNSFGLAEAILSSGRCSQNIDFPTLVTPRGPSTKQFWGGLEQFGEQLEELGIGDDAMPKMATKT